MKTFAMPVTLPTGVAELETLAGQAKREIHRFQEKDRAGLELTRSDVDRLEFLLDGYTTVRAAKKRAASAAVTAPPPMPELDIAIGAHEAAHAVVAALHGGLVARAEVFATPRRRVEFGVQMEQGGVCSPHLDFVADQSSHLIAAAGIAGEAVARFGPRPSHSELAAVLNRNTSDRKKIMRATQNRGDVVRVVQSVIPTALRCWPAIASLAVKMCDDGPISHADVTAALGLSADGAAHSYELAAIRSGLRSVPNPPA